MSNATLSPGSAKSSDLIYEEDNHDEQNSATLEPSSSIKSKNTVFIEDFLNNFLKESRTHQETLRKVHGSSSRDAEISQKTVAVLDFEIDAIEPSTFVHSALSDIFSLKVRYKVTETPSSNVDNNDEKVSFLIVKVPPSDPEDRQLAALATVQQREILFYSTVIRDITEWCEVNNYTGMNFAFAQCYYAHFNRPLEKRAVSGILENLSKAESIIVLEDLRPQGYGKRHYVQSLSLVEVKTALREIAKIHATTWAMQESMDFSLGKKWNFYYKAEYIAMLYEALLETGFPKLEQYLRQLVEANRDMEATRVLAKLSVFRSRGLRETIVQLLNPAEYPSPTCLIHTDFWTDNIFFRKRDPLADEANDYGFNSGSDIKNEAARAVADILLKTNGSFSHFEQSELFSEEELELECKILDWQIFSIGKPTHDIALFLITSLSPETRRENEQMLLEFYWKCFQNVVGKFEMNINFDFECLQTEYKSSCLFAVLQISASSDLALNDQATQERLFAALSELVNLKLI